MSHGHDLPDAGEGMCCMGAAVYGAHRCTCWTETLSVEPVDEVYAGPAAIRPKMCSDCAFRHDSPEATDDPRYQGDIAGILAQDDFFYCHEGMPKVVERTHQPTGVVVPADGDAYRPERSGNTPLKADGTPAFVCCGYATVKGMLGW